MFGFGAANERRMIEKTILNDVSENGLERKGKREGKYFGCVSLCL